MRPAPELVDRFRSDLDGLIAPDARIGIAVSGGPDSMALLLLAVAARPGLVEAATVDHALRPESRAEAEVVAGVCKELGVPHAILTAGWRKKPTTGVQERARRERYRLLGRWAEGRKLAAIATAHHLDDQAETFVMRLRRGAGVRGLAGMRATAKVPGFELPLLRPLLSWRRSDLVALCETAGIAIVTDPSNADDQFERVRVRQALAGAGWLDAAALATSATNLAEADAALNWAVEQEWERAVTAERAEISYRPDAAPSEIRRRIAGKAIVSLGTEGQGADLRGRELDRLLATLESGSRMTLRGVLCSGGEQWRFVPAPKRTRRVTNSR